MVDVLKESEVREAPLDHTYMTVVRALYSEQDFANVSNPQSGDARGDGESAFDGCTLTSSSIEAAQFAKDCHALGPLVEFQV